MVNEVQQVHDVKDHWNVNEGSSSLMSSKASGRPGWMLRNVVCDKGPLTPFARDATPYFTTQSRYEMILSILSWALGVCFFFANDESEMPS